MPDRVLIRSRFWPRFLRWAIGFQILLALLVGTAVVSRGLDGQPLATPRDAFSWGVTAALMGGFSLVLAFRRRKYAAAEINPVGVWPYLKRWGRDPLFPWDAIGTVRVQVDWFGRRWLEVHPLDSPPFVLTARPADPEAVLDALERFAGPDHPLTQAYFMLLDR